MSYTDWKFPKIKNIPEEFELNEFMQEMLEWSTYARAYVDSRNALIEGTDLDLDNNDIINVNAIQFDLTPTHTHSEGSIHWDEDDKTLHVDTEVDGVALQVGQEIFLRATNKTGSTITNGQVVYVDGAQGQRPTIALADSDTVVTSEKTIGLATHDISNNNTGYITTFGLVRGLNTSSWSEGDELYLTSTAGSLTNVMPSKPEYSVRVGYVIYSHATEGKIFVEVHPTDHRLLNNIGTYLDHDDIETLLGVTQAAIVETIDIDVDASGATIEFQLQGNGGTDLQIVTTSGIVTMDTTPAATIDLTAGTATVPQLNYIYIDENLTLQKSTSVWPETWHTPIAAVVVLDRATTNTYGTLRTHAYTDHLTNGDGGHLSHIGKRIRFEDAIWESGVATTTTPAVSATAGSVSFAVSSGLVWQMHDQSYPALDGGSTGHFIVNHPTTPYTNTTDLATINVDAENNSLTNKYYSLVLWGTQSQKTVDCQLMINLPSGSYTTSSAATRDADKYSNYTIPNTYKGVAFLIARVTIRNVANTNYTIEAVEDLRGQTPGTSAGGGAGITSHGDLSGLTDDDHTQYPLLLGRSGGQTLIGGTASGDDLTLQSTSNATKGSIILGSNSAYDEVNDILGIGTASPIKLLHLQATSNPTIRLNESATTTSYLEVTNSSATQSFISHTTVSGSGQSLLDLAAAPGDGTSTGYIRINRGTDTSGANGVLIHVGDNTATVQHALLSNADSYVCADNGNFGIGTDNPGAKVHIKGTVPEIKYEDTDGGDVYNVGNNAGKFLIYNATDTRTDFIVNGDGYVGVGFSTPSYLLEVYEDRASNYVARFRNDGDDANRYGIIIQCGEDTPTANPSAYFISFNEGDGYNTGFILADGGGVVSLNPSDERIKVNIAPTDVSGLSTINDINIIKYNKVKDVNPDKSKRKRFVNDIPNERRYFYPEVRAGFSAQNLQQAFPEAVSSDPEGTLGVSDTKLIPVLIKAIQELSTKNDELVARIEALEALQ